MRTLSRIGVLVVLVAVATHGLAADTSQAAAEAAAQKWLDLIDGGNYSQSWSTAAKLFRDSVAEAQWDSKISAVRGPLGAVKSRSITSAQFTHSLPGVPDGDYVVIRYATSFEHKSEAAETVTPMKDTDGQWRVSGYFIR